MSKRRHKKANAKAKAQQIKGKKADMIIVDDVFKPQQYVAPPMRRKLPVPPPGAEIVKVDDKGVEVDLEAGWKPTGFWPTKWTKEELDKARENSSRMERMRDDVGVFTREMVERVYMTDAEVHAVVDRLGIPIEELVAVCKRTGMAPAAVTRSMLEESTTVIGGRRYGRSAAAKAATALMGLGEAARALPPALREAAERMTEVRKVAALMEKTSPFRGLTPEMLARTEPGPRIFVEGEVIHSAGYNFHVVEIDRDVIKGEFTFWAVIKDGQGMVQTKTPAHVDSRALEMVAATGNFEELRKNIVMAWTQEAQRYYAVEAAPSDFVDTLIEKVQDVWVKHFPSASEPVGDDEELDDGDGMGAADVRALRRDIEELLWPSKE